MGGVAPANLVPLSEKPFVCLRYFRLRENTFTSFNREQSFALICASHCLTCVAGAKRKPERIGGTKRGALVPRREPSPRSVVFRHRPENKVFRLVARQNPFTEGVLAAPPVPLKVKATDTALRLSLKSQYRLPINLFWGLGLRPYLRQPLFNLCCRGKREEMQNPRKRDSSCVPTNYVHWSEKSFVCLRHFRIRENTFTPFNREQSSALICASHCLTCVAGAKRERAGANFTTVSEKPFVRPRIFAQQKCTLLARNGILSVLRNRVHTNVVRSGKLHSFIGETVCLPEAFPRDGNARFFEKRIALVSTVERANAVKAPTVS